MTMVDIWLPLFSGEVSKIKYYFSEVGNPIKFPKGLTFCPRGRPPATMDYRKSLDAPLTR